MAAYEWMEGRVENYRGISRDTVEAVAELPRLDTPKGLTQFVKVIDSNVVDVFVTYSRSKQTLGGTCIMVVYEQREQFPNVVRTTYLSQMIYNWLRYHNHL